MRRRSVGWALIPGTSMMMGLAFTGVLGAILPRPPAAPVGGPTPTATAGAVAPESEPERKPDPPVETRETAAPATTVWPVAAEPVEPAAPAPTFDERPIVVERVVRMVVTAYSPGEESCGEWADGMTASGYSVWTNGMCLAAADTDLLPFGSLVSVPGYHAGRVVPVLDRGGAIRGKRLDVLMPTHEAALRWGKRELPVTVWRYADVE